MGTPVLAPFSGTVIDPRKHWIPWDPARYGKVVAIQSDEPTSVGYTVILVHLSSIGAPIGVHVTRGQVVGLTGITGDAAGTIPHLHLELRAPFLIRYVVKGVVRRVDSFDPQPVAPRGRSPPPEVSLGGAPPQARGTFVLLARTGSLPTLRATYQFLQQDDRDHSPLCPPDGCDAFGDEGGPSAGRPPEYDPCVERPGSPALLPDQSAR